MGQYNSGYRRPDFSGSQNFGVPSNSSLAPVPASEPKSKTKLLIIIISIAVILIVVFALIGGVRNGKKEEQAQSEDEFYGLIDQIRDEYSIYMNVYDEIIMNNNKVFSEDPSKIIVTEESVLLDLFERRDEFNNLINELNNINNGKMKFLNDEQRNTFQEMTVEINKTNQDINQNISLYEDLYNSFIMPINEQSQQNRPSQQCDINESALLMLKSDDEEIKTIADGYKKTYCDFMTNISSQSSEAEAADFIQRNDANVEETFNLISLKLKTIDSDNIIKNIDKVYNGKDTDEK